MQDEQIIRDAINRVGCQCIAVVAERVGVLDIAVAWRGNTALVVRYVDRPQSSDYSQLKTMLAQGDFDRAVLVYSGDCQPDVSDEIETYPLSRIDELAASLARERAP